MKRKIMSVSDIEKRLGDVWFTNGWGERFPARRSYVMLAIENGVFFYDLHGDGGERIKGSSARICIHIGGKERDPQDYGVSFFKYGNGRGKLIFSSDIDAKNIRLDQKHDQNVMELKLRCSKGVIFLRYPKDAIIYEDDWRKCKKCKIETRLGDDLWGFMTRGRFGYGEPAHCSACGHPSKYY